MQTIQNLITTLTTQAQTLLLPALLVAAIVIGGFFIMTGDHRGGRGWIIGGLVGAAVVLGASGLASLVSKVPGG